MPTVPGQPTKPTDSLGMSDDFLDRQLTETMAEPTSSAVRFSEDDPFDQVLLGSAEALKLKRAISEGAKIPPDHAARLLRLQITTGLPLEFIGSDPDFVEQEVARRGFDAEALRKSNPVVTSWMAEHKEHAALAQDDFPRLSLTEKLLNALKQGYHQLRQGGSALSAVSEQKKLDQATVVDDLLATGRDPSTIPDFQDPYGYRYMTPAQRWAFKAKAQEGVAAGAQRLVERQRTIERIPRDPVVSAALNADSFADFWHFFTQKPVETILTVGATSVPLMAPGLALAVPLGVAGGVAAGAGGIGVGSFGVDYATTMIQAMQAEGVDITNQEAVTKAVQDKALMGRVGAQAFAHAVPVAVMDAVSAGVAGKLLVPKVITGTVAKPAMNLAAQAPVQGTLGAAGEAAGEVAAGQPIQPGQIMAEFFGEFATAPIEVAGMATGRAKEEYRKVLKAKEQETFFTALGEGVKGSKTYERLPEKLQEIVSRITKDGPVATLYVPSDRFATYFQEQGIDPRQAAQAITGNVEAYDQAVASGADLAIPTADYATKIAPTPANAFFARELRTAPDLMNAREAEEYIARAMAEAEAALATPEAHQAQTAREGAAKVGQDVTGQLLAAGFDPHVAEQYAQLFESRYQARAERRGLGENPLELFQSLNLNIQRVLPEILTRLGQQTTEIDALLDQLRTGNVPTEKQRYGQSLGEMLREAGGVQDQGGELSHMGIDDVRKPFQRNLIQEKGLTLERATERAVEAGYLYEQDINAFLDLLREEARGTPQYAIGQENQAALTLAQNLAALQRYLDEQEIDLSTMTNEAVKALLQQAAQAQPTTEGQTFEQAQNIDDAIAILQSEFPDIRFFLSETSYNHSQWKLQDLVVPEEQRGHGMGSQFMARLTELADQQQKTIVLNPARKDDRYGTTSQGRLIAFYRRFGFVRNKGRHKDYRISETMYRRPQTAAGQTFAQSSMLLREKMRELAEATGPKVLGDVGAFILDEPTREHFRDTLDVQVNADPTMPETGKTLVYPNMTGTNKAVIKLHPLADAEVFFHEVIHAQRAVRGRDFGPESTQRLEESAEKGGKHFVVGVTYNQSMAPERGPGSSENAQTPPEPGRDWRDTSDSALARAANPAPSRLPFSDTNIDNISRAILAVKEGKIGSMAFADIVAANLPMPPEDKQGSKTAGDIYIGSITDNLSSYFGDYLNDLGIPVLDPNGTPMRFGKAGPRENYEIRSDRPGEYLVGKNGANFLTRIKGTSADDAWDNFQRRFDGRVMTYGDPAGGGGIAISSPVMRQRPELYDVIISQFRQNPTRLLQWLRKDLEFRKEEQEASVWFFEEAMRDAARLAKEETPEGLRAKLKLIEGGKSSPNLSGPQQGGPSFFQAGGKEAKGAITFGAGRIDIKLLEKADLSTFLHETGHLYLAELITDALMPGTSQQLRDDLDTTLAWMGLSVRVADGADAIRAAVQTAQHEQFARGFEAYAMEGKAPSQALREVFARFRQWLIQVYRLLTGHGVVTPEAGGEALSVRLTKDVRAVMDRLLATDEAITAAAQEGDLEPLFTDAARAGMTEAEFANYRETVAQASLTARERLQAQLMAQLQREQQAWWTEQREQVKAEVTAEVNQQKDYIALSVLQKGILPDGSPLPEGVTAAKLDTQALVDEFGVEFLKRLPRGIRADKGGISLTQAAYQFGYPSGHDLVLALVNARPKQQLIEAETDLRMQQQYGDMRFDGTIAEQARHAVLNEQVEQVVEAELKALAKKQRDVAPFVKTALAETRAEGLASFWSIPSREVVNRIAREQIGRTKLRDVQPFTYFVAARKASREAMVAMAKDDYRTAMDRKQKELLNLALYREAQAAKDETQTFYEHMVSLRQKSAQERIGKAGGDYLDQINELLERFEFVRVPIKLLQSRQSLNEWITEKEKTGETLGEELAVPESVRNEARRVNYRDLTYDELLGLRDTVTQIEHLARLKNKLLKKKGQREKAQVRDALIAAVEAAYADRGAPPLTAHGLTAMQKANRLAQQMDASMLKTEQLVEWLDGGPTGPWHDALWNPAVDAQAAEYDATKAITAQIARLVMTMPATIRDRMLETVTIPGIENTVVRKDLIGVALNLGNQSNYDKLLKGMGWTPAQVQDMADQLTAEEITFVNGIVNTLETLWPEIAALQKRLTGVEPEKIVAKPFQARNGLLTGGYYPIMYDPILSKQGQIQEAGRVGELTNQTRATIPSGHRKARIEGFARPFDLNVDHLPSHLAGVIKDLTHREWMHDARWITDDPTIRAVLQRRVGDQAVVRLSDWVDQVVNDRNYRSTASMAIWQRMIEHFRYNTLIVAMGFKAATHLVQLAGVAPAIEVIGGKDLDGATWYAKGLRDTVTKPRSTYEFMIEKSGEMRHRIETRDRDLRDKFLLLEGRTDTLANVQRASIQSIAWAELLGVSMSSWRGAYLKALHAGMTDEQAVRMGDRAVRLSQGAGGAKDLAAVAARSDQLTRVFTMFFTPFSALYGRLRAIGHDFGGIQDVPGAAVRLFITVAVASALGELLAGRGPDEDKDESWLAWWGQNAALYPFMAIPLMRDVLSAIVQGYSYQFTPLADAFTTTISTVSVAKKVAEGEKELSDLAEKSVKAFSYLIGLPTSQLEITGTYLKDLYDGRAHPDNIFQFAHDMMYKRPKDER